jgi:hypothetical protein
MLEFGIASLDHRAVENAITQLDTLANELRRVVELWSVQKRYEYREDKKGAARGEEGGLPDDPGPRGDDQHQR